MLRSSCQGACFERAFQLKLFQYESFPLSLSHTITKIHFTLLLLIIECFFSSQSAHAVFNYRKCLQFQLKG